MDSFLEMGIVTIKGKAKLHYRINDQFTAVVGVFKNDAFKKPLYDTKVELLIKAVNNRTRERNYFKKYIELLDDEISPEEFDKEIEENEDLYVVTQNDEVSKEEIWQALELSQRLMDVNDVDDMANLFSFSENSIRKSITEKQ